MNDLPNIVFFGSDAICLPGLNYLKNEASGLCHLCAVVSRPDSRQGRGKKSQPNPVAAWAVEYGVELLQPEKPDRELAAHLSGQKVVASLVMAYGCFLGKPLREFAPNGMVNFHGSFLPKYRGASPVETAIAMGESETGVCLMDVVEKMDAGGVADVKKVRIEKSDTGLDVRGKIGRAVVTLLRRNLARLLMGPLDFEPQDTTRVSFCRKIMKIDGAIDFNLPAEAIDCRLRAFTPWPGGYFDHDGDRIKVGRADLVLSTSEARPGTVLDCSGGVIVATGEGAIRFLELQRPGGRMLPVTDFLNGYPLKQGAVLKGGSAQPLIRSD